MQSRRLFVPLAAVILAGVTGFALLLALGNHRPWVIATDDISEAAIAAAAALACSLAAWRGPRRGRLGWSLLAAGTGFWAIGEAVWSWLELGRGQSDPFPSAADGFFVPAALLIIAAVLTLPVWPRSEHARLRMVLDGLVVALSIYIVSGATVLDAVLSTPQSNLASLLGITYPIADVVVLAMLGVLLMHVSVEARLTVGLLIGGLAALAVSDSTFAYLNASTGYGSGSALDTGWTAGFALIGLAAVRSLHVPLGIAIARPFSKRSVLMPYLPIPVLIIAGVWYTLAVGPLPAAAVTGGCMLVLLVVGRQLIALLDNLSLLQRLGNREQELHHSAHHDVLTDLPNRQLFLRTAETVLANPEREGMAAVMFIDLDDFKLINDSLGHSVGDQAIIEVANRLRECVRDDDLVARLGGDEFAVFLERLPGVKQLIEIADRIIESLDVPFLTMDLTASVRGTIGIAIAAEDDDDAGELLRRADIAMYAAKGQGKSLYGIFEPSMHVALNQPLERRAGLEHALAQEQFILHYQPILETESRKIVGIEALMRWNHPQLGILPPGEFMLDLEQAELMVEAGTWVLREATRRTARLRDELGVDLFVSVNVASRQLYHNSFVETVAKALQDSGLPPEALVIELTESGNVGDSEVASSRLRAVRQTGVRVAIDDFGTGYSSLTYLQRLPIDILKIDKSFIDHLLEGGQDGALVEGLVRLGLTLGLAMVAEGVEVEEQHAALQELGCPLAQGFLHARPMSVEALKPVLSERCRQLSEEPARVF